MRLLPLAMVVGVVSPAALAPAQDAVPTPEVSERVSGGSRVDPGLDRPYLFFTDPTLPAPGHVIVSLGLGSITQSGEERPIGAGPLLPTVSGEVGIIPRLSLFVAGEFAFDSSGQTAEQNFGIGVGAHILLTDPGSQDIRVALQALFGRDFSGSAQIALNATAVWDIQRLRLGASLTGSHYFSGSADTIDVNGVLAVSYLLPFSFRLGVESTAQDIEEVANAEDEGGTSVFLGPTLGWEFLHRFQIVAGPMFGLTTGSASVLARGAASVLF